jgi:hypothetical protein
MLLCNMFLSNCLFKLGLQPILIQLTPARNEHNVSFDLWFYGLRHDYGFS